MMMEKLVVMIIVSNYSRCFLANTNATTSSWLPINNEIPSTHFPSTFDFDSFLFGFLFWACQIGFLLKITAFSSHFHSLVSLMGNW